jgi:putative redox protein
MQQVKAVIGRDHYKTILYSDTNSQLADEPLSVGGTDMGFSPDELMASSLAACTAITVRMYADRKKMDLDQIEVNVSVEWNNDTAQTNMIKTIRFVGNITDEEKERLIVIAGKCPTHKMLSNPVTITTVTL